MGRFAGPDWGPSTMADELVKLLNGKWALFDPTNCKKTEVTYYDKYDDYKKGNIYRTPGNNWILQSGKEWREFVEITVHDVLDCISQTYGSYPKSKSIYESLTDIDIGSTNVSHKFVT